MLGALKMGTSRYRRKISVGLLLLPLCVSVWAAPQYYKWKDADGAVHYADAPPAHIKAERVSVRGGHEQAARAPAQAEPAPSTSVSALDKAEANYRKQSCVAAKNDLDTLSSGRLVVQGIDPSSATRMSDADREVALKAAQLRVEQYCDAK